MAHILSKGLKKGICFLCILNITTITNAMATKSVKLQDIAAQSLPRRLYIKDNIILDANQNPVKLRGIYTRSEWLKSEQEVEWFRQWGINFVRILLTYDKDYWQVINNGKVDHKKRCILRESNLVEMDQRCQWLEKNNIYYMVEIPWRWYGIEQKLQKPELLAKQFSAMYKTLAQRYKGNEYLMGFCMFSEIYVAPHLYRDYKKICTEIVDAVHSVDSGLFVSATGVAVSGPQSLTFETRIERPNVIYDFHYYDIKSFTHYRSYYGDMRYPGRVPHGFSGRSYYLDKELNKTMISTAIAFSSRWKVPIWCGEFGAFNNAPDGSSDRWMRDVSYIFEQYNIPWIIWTWRPGLKDVPGVWKDLWQGKPNHWATINPHGGNFIDPVFVKMETWLDDADIYYTLDGSEPDENSGLYNSPIKIDKNTTVKARIFKNGLNCTPVDTATFKFGGRKPDAVNGKIVPGLNYKYFSGVWEKIKEIENFDPVEIGTAENIDTSIGLKNDQTTLEFTGYLKIEKAGRYFFYPKAYGAYELYIGDKLVSLHNASKYEWALTSPGIITLEVGLHQIKIIYSKPKDYYGGFLLYLQRDEQLVHEPFRVDGSMLFRVEN